jgi:hypothetical protein
MREGVLEHFVISFLLNHLGTLLASASNFSVGMYTVYDKSLQEHLTSVRQAFIGQWGLWDSSQEIIAELISNAQGQAWNYQDFCIAIDSHDSFKIGPLLRPFDDYIQYFSLADSQRLQQSLNELITFLDSRRTPERRTGNLA